MKSRSNGIGKALWSIAIPGFGQLLNQNYFKGILLIILEFIINVNSHLNTAIIASFYGNMEAAINYINYQWLMFYPCVYIFAIWDAYKTSTNSQVFLLDIPFAMAAYLGTIGVIYSSTMEIFGILLGPIFLPLLFIFLGFGIGLIIRSVLRYYLKVE